MYVTPQGDKLPPPKPNLSYTRPPKSPIAYWVWRRRMWVEATFAMSMLEPWEKLMLLIIFCVLFVLVVTGLLRYLPHHIYMMQRRAIYYLWGQEGDGRLLSQIMFSGKETATASGGSGSVHVDL